MTLTPGQRIGNYEVLSPLGAGGMGEVYRGRDTRLDRIVAIKALPAGFAGEPERLARFEREARLLAALNHPNIAGIHGIEDASSADEEGPYLVLEFVEGETLAQRIARGPLSVRETLRICTQVASAIEAAHERGIVHRDLKPGNIMLSGSQSVKVLDFGLAKGDEPAGESTSDPGSPTIPGAATADGIILGTAAYMSPEQARGKPVDKRGDVWAFGCILMECLTGRQTFSGETASDVIARILERDPDWKALPPRTPPRLAALLKRCLTKEAEHRPRDIGDLGRELDAILREVAGASSRPTAPTESLPSLAVLYFENLAQDPESEYFCSGITEDILTDLSKIKGIRVASRNAVSRFRGKEIDLLQVARDLGVRAILEGTVRRAGDRIRITTQLINANDGFQLWAERYDRTLEDVFAVQDEIAASIVAALRVAMTPSDVVNLAKDRPNDARAYDLYLKGRDEYTRYRKESLEKALELFREAIDIDANYALAWAGIADCHGQFLQWGWAEDTDETIRLGLEAARKATTLDPRLPEGYKAESLVLRNTGDLDGSLRALKQALQADPDFTPALINIAVHYFTVGDLAGAERQVRRVLQVDPQEAFAHMWLASVLFRTLRYDESLASCRRVDELSDRTFYRSASLAMRISVHLRRGEIAAAEELFRESVEQNADPEIMRSREALVAAHQGRSEVVKRILQEISGSVWNNPDALGALASAAVRIGEHDLAIQLLDRGRIPGFLPILVRLEPDLHPLLDREPYAPRRLDHTLVWPLQAPMIDEARHALFRHVCIESAKPEGSQMLGTESGIS
jgi:serine/threonine protein kinase/Flp pilus assembly protein TadD